MRQPDLLKVETHFAVSMMQQREDVVINSDRSAGRFSLGRDSHFVPLSVVFSDQR